MNKIFGFVVAVQPPASTAVDDIWLLQAYARVGSEEGLSDPSAETADASGELALRLSSAIHGMARPSSAGPYQPHAVGHMQELLASVSVYPRQPESARLSWRTPAELACSIWLQLPKQLPLQLVNATLRISAPVGVRLACSRPPEPFLAGTLPPGMLCFDIENSQDSFAIAVVSRVRVGMPSQAVLAIDNFIPLQASAIYNFTMYIIEPTIDYAMPKLDRAWPSKTAWSFELQSGGDQFRTTLAATLGVEGDATAPRALRDLGLLTSSTRENSLAKVTLLFSIPIDCRCQRRWRSSRHVNLFWIRHHRPSTHRCSQTSSA
jgi:hypothetical protein